MPDPTLASNPAMAAIVSTATASVENAARGPAGVPAQGLPFAVLFSQQLAAQIADGSGQAPALDLTATDLTATDNAPADPRTMATLIAAMLEGTLPAGPALAGMEQAAQFQPILAGAANPALPGIHVPAAFAKADPWKKGDDQAAAPLATAIQPADPAQNPALVTAAPVVAVNPLVATSVKSNDAAPAAAAMPSAILAAGSGESGKPSLAAAPQGADEAAFQLQADPGREQRHASAMENPLPQIAQAATAAAAHAPARIETAVGTPRWDGEFADRLAWMVGRNEQRAELVLNPPQLGRIEISISVSGDQANAIFVSPNSTVRDAIEHALPRLREVLADAGITLGQTQVGSESPNPSPKREENGDNPSRMPANGQEARPLPVGLAGGAQPVWLRGGRGMVDVFA